MAVAAAGLMSHFFQSAHLLAIALTLVGCADQPAPPTPMALDSLPATATITSAGTRDLVEIWIDPTPRATLGGVPVGRLKFRLDLSKVTDCSANCERKVALDGAAITGAFLYGSFTYDIEPATNANTGVCPFVQEGDPLHLQRGTIGGSFTFRELDGDGARIAIMLSPTFGIGFPYPNVPHVVGIGDFDVRWSH